MIPFINKYIDIYNNNKYNNKDNKYRHPFNTQPTHTHLFQNTPTIKDKIVLSFV